MNDFMLEYSQQLNSFELEVGMYEHINVSEGNPEGNLWGPLYIFSRQFPKSRPWKDNSEIVIDQARD